MVKSNSTSGQDIYYRRTCCRLCSSEDVELVFGLEPTPPAEWYSTPDRSFETERTFPLDLYLCHTCGHVQIFDVIDPLALFSNYAYTSASSPGLESHFESYAGEVLARTGLRKGQLVVDVGSNDGTLLRFFLRDGMRVLGIDPAVELARQATISGIPTMAAFMGPEAAAEIALSQGHASLITANNVFAHNDDLDSMAAAIVTLLDDEGAFVFEVSNLLDTVEGLVFDFIYHEHLCYHSVKPLDTFLRKHGMELFEVERVPSKGGSLRGYAQKLNGPRPISPSVARFVKREIEAGLYNADTYHDYITEVNRRRDALLAYLYEAKANGSVIAGYGASATVTTLLYHFRMGELVEFLVDDNPIRHGTVSPGLHIPVLAPDALYELKPDIVVILAWRFADSILSNHGHFLDEGGEFVVPLPDLHFVRR